MLLSDGSVAAEDMSGVSCFGVCLCVSRGSSFDDCCFSDVTEVLGGAVGLFSPYRDDQKTTIIIVNTATCSCCLSENGVGGGAGWLVLKIIGQLKVVLRSLFLTLL